MKIALVCPRYWPYRGGVERYVQEIATRLSSQNEVEILTTDPYARLPPRERLQLTLSVKRFRSWAPGDAIYHSTGLFRHLLRYSRQYDIVHANSYHALPAYYAAESKRCNKLVFTPHFHGTVGHSKFRSLLHIAYRPFGKRMFEKADRVICAARFERNRILQAFRVPVSKLVRIEEGIIRIPRKSKSKSEERKSILCIARFERYKGIQHVIMALPNLGRDFNLMLVGSGPYENKLRSLVARLGLTERVVFMRNVSDEELPHLYHQANVAVLLSEHEGYSLFIGEALSAGIPCVVARRSALEEWVDEQNCVGLDNPSDPTAVAQAILCVTNREVSLTLPTWDDYVKRLADLYDDVLNH